MINRPVKTGMSVNGKAMDLENYLLNVIDRPLPKAPTHYIVADVLNTDLSIKRVTIYFNPADTWKGNYGFSEHSPESVGLAIENGLLFLNNDPNTLAYKCWTIEIATDKVVHESRTYTFTKCEI